MKRVMMIDEHHTKDVILVNKGKSDKIMTIDDTFIPKSNNYELLDKITPTFEVEYVKKEFSKKENNKEYYVIKYNPNTVILDETMLEYKIN